ncbi:Gti1/Pac2 family-domain-containing protein [Lentinula raphanica]|uniref:Gti1/Pac2 family-domain-containing protein n=1 Tax=Lentinula raphanica TaxID=153919 RepID=A0AA38UDP9_9AGAR|nr:Gti1/Pac2 family-domain-containing protein [Lentinula raphanica]
MSTSISPPSTSHQPPPTTRNDPPWVGWIETTGDALLILEAARRGLIPRVTRRLVDSERKMITSGSVFVFDEDESGIKRWTDGFFWSPSRILGNFLLYRETDKRGPGHKGSGSGSSRSQEDAETDAGNTQASQESHSLSRPKSETSNNLGFDKLRERSLMGSLTNSYKFKSDGLMKKTFSLTIGGVAQHLISYYRIEDVENGRLRSPSSLPELASLDISPEYLDKTHFRNPPKVEVGPDGVPRYRGEADELEPTTSSILTAPLSTGLPLLTDGRVTDSGNNKRPNKRFEPYPAGLPAPKRQRKRNDDRSPESPNEEDPSSRRQRSSSQTPTPSTSSQPPLPHSTYTGTESPPAGGVGVAPPQPAYAGYYPVPPGFAPPQGMYPYPSPHHPSFMPAQGPGPTPPYAPGLSYSGSPSPGTGTGPGIPTGQAYYGYRQPYPFPGTYPPGTTWASYPYPAPQPAPASQHQSQPQQPVQPIPLPVKDAENLS